MKPVYRLYSKYIAFILACFLLAFLFRLFFISHPKSSRDLAEIQKEGVLRVVTEYGMNSYYVSGDTIAGFQYEMAHWLADALGVELDISLENNLSKCIQGLNKQKYDIIARNIPVTSENKKVVSFTDPIVFDRQVLVQRTAKYNDGLAPIRNQIDLGQKTVYVPENSPAILRLRNLSEEIADTIYMVEEKRYAAEQLIYMIVNKEIDYAVIDRQTAHIFQKRFPELDIQTDIGFTQLQSWAVRKDAVVLIDSINKYLERPNNQKHSEISNHKSLITNIF